MLFMVISTPRAERPSEMNAYRQQFWAWMQPLLDTRICQSIHARVGRGAIALFDVDSNLTLHRLMNEWADIIPAHFDVYPLLDESVAKQFLHDQMEPPKKA